MVTRVGRYVSVLCVFLMGGGLVMTTGTAAAADKDQVGMDIARTMMTRAVAIQEIEYLRRLYARATDRIGENTPDAIAEGRAVYHRIFTPDVALRVKGDAPARDSTGPEAWVTVVVDALASFAATQHLIGTQLVDIESLEIDAVGNIVAGEASMSSYLQAWHARPNDNVWLFLGTYRDKVRYQPGVGWQIYDTTLERVSGEERPMGKGS